MQLEAFVILQTHAEAIRRCHNTHTCMWRHEEPGVTQKWIAMIAGGNERKQDERKRFFDAFANYLKQEGAGGHVEAFMRTPTSRTYV